MGPIAKAIISLGLRKVASTALSAADEMTRPPPVNVTPPPPPPEPRAACQVAWDTLKWWWRAPTWAKLTDIAIALVITAAIVWLLP